MLRVGITGGIGSGKTAVTDWLAQKGITIVDADVVARLVVAPGMPALAEIANTFGAEYLASSTGPHCASWSLPTRTSEKC